MNFSKSILESRNNKGGSPAQELPDEMSKRTVINRTCKRLINTSSDAILMDDELLERNCQQIQSKSQSRKEKYERKSD
jgi:recombinational DNA repair protein RecT